MSWKPPLTPTQPSELDTGAPPSPGLQAGGGDFSSPHQTDRPSGSGWSVQRAMRPSSGGLVDN